MPSGQVPPLHPGHVRPFPPCPVPSDPGPEGAPEREDEALHTWELSMVPGLLQGEGHARALIGNEPGVSRERAEERVAARLDSTRPSVRNHPQPRADIRWNRR
ncbi:Scr1 family TA system antitoxin-like transcriptional regulator [Streptosporangium roseum]|uniref:Scr1 family TA system antitoxin-like transcriptional regulator n=1 Tax=Streptosporangium roseum TaxID=2001 RepID=UPI003AFA7669